MIEFSPEVGGVYLHQTYPSDGFFPFCILRIIHVFGAISSFFISTSFTFF